MAINLGLIASQITGHLNNNSFESIATFTIGAGGSSSGVTFNNIPQTYKHLQIRMLVQGTGPDIIAQYNSDTSQSYFRHYLYGNGSTPNSGGNTSVSNNWVEFAYTPSTANVFSASVTDILDYTSTSKIKVNRSFTGYDTNSAGNIILYSGAWNSTAAITSILIGSFSGSLNQNTHIALYGIKG